MESTKITFLVTNSNPATELGFETWLDDQKIIDIEHVQTTVEVSIPVNDNDGDHVLKLVLKGKQANHTVLNANGDIVSDAVLSIQDLAFDGIALGHIVTEKTVYTHNFNGHGTESQHQFFGVMGCNGTAELSFTTPMYLWLLENM
jgi:isocitrate dehydrogenase